MIKLNPTPADELKVLRELRDEIHTLITLAEGNFEREHGAALRKMHTLVLRAVAYERAQR